MPLFDLPLEQLRGYHPRLTAPPDLGDFWLGTLAEASEHDLDPRFHRVDSGLVTVETYDVSFSGYAGHRISGWLHLPARSLRAGTLLPGVVQYQGYNGGRGLAHEHQLWASAGYAHLVMDTRGQGSGWSVGVTPDPVGSGAAQPGHLTRGIERPHDHYYRRLITDAVRAVETLRSHPAVDGERVAVAGVSQGGGLALAVAALVPGLAAVMPDVPFLCDFRRASEVSPVDPYGEIVRYLRAHRDRKNLLFETLSYFDGAILAPRASAPALFSVALMDQTCPPSTVFAAFHAYGGPKEIEIYEYNDHEGGAAFQQQRQLAWLEEALSSTGKGLKSPALEDA